RRLPRGARGPRLLPPLEPLLRARRGPPHGRRPPLPLPPGRAGDEGGVARRRGAGGLVVLPRVCGALRPRRQGRPRSPPRPPPVGPAPRPRPPPPLRPRRLRVLGAVLPAPPVPHVRRPPRRGGPRRRARRASGPEPRPVLEAADEVRVRPRHRRPHPGVPRPQPRPAPQRVPPVPPRRRDRRVRGLGGAGPERVRLVHDDPPGEGARVPRRPRRLAGGGPPEPALRPRRAPPDGALREAAVRAVRPDQALRLLAALLHGVLAGPERAGTDGARPAERARPEPLEVL